MKVLPYCVGLMEVFETLTSSYVVAGEVKASVVNCVHLACFNHHAFLGHKDNLVLRDLSTQLKLLFCCKTVWKHKRAIFQVYTKTKKVCS